MLHVHKLSGLYVDPVRGVVYRRDGRAIHTPDRYGYTRVNFSVGKKPKVMLAHRIVWEVANGPIPDGLCINHKNFVRWDNRISNLEVVTQAENLAHSRAAGRMKNPPPPKNKKLSSAQADEVRALHAAGERPKDIAARYAVTTGCIYAIVQGRSHRKEAA